MNDMDDKPVLLVVDDQPENIHLVGNVLGEHYTVLAATNGEKALQIAAENPDLRLVLMDVMMPGMDGYEVTRRLKGNVETSHLVVIFVSALDSVENIVSGYEAGGADYLVKPIQPDELSRKVELVFENEKQRKALQEEKAMAMETAMTAMVAGGEQGVLLDFMRQSFNVKSVDALARQVVDSCAGYDLNVSVQFRSDRQVFNAARDEPMSPMEELFLSRVKNAGRLRERGRHFVANFGDITLLVKDMPDDEEKRGRLRDHLAILLEGAEIRFKNLLVQDGIGGVLQLARQDVADIKDMQFHFKTAVTETLDDLLMNLEASFLSYGLTEDQEDMLKDVVHKALHQTMDNFEITLHIEDKIQTLVKKLQVLADKS